MVHLVVDPAAATPLHRQVYDGLREAILAGRLARGARLPSTRALARDLGVARNTVLQAYEQLRSEGYLQGRRGGGTRARSVLPDTLLTVPRRAAPRGRDDAAQRRRTDPARAGDVAPTISARGRALADTGAMLIRRAGPHAPFELGVPAIDAFPLRRWAQLAGRRWRRGDIDLGELDPAGEPALREAIAAYVGTARGVRCSADQVLVLNGTQQALHLLAQVLLDPGDAVWLEEPGYVGARVAFVASGARLVPVRVDDEGLDVEHAMRRAPNARLAYVTPSHQFPLGVVLSAARRLQLLAWARASGAWIVEDDYDSEFRYAGRPLPSLQGLEAERLRAGRSARVLYLGTFSKTLVSGLRLGYMVVPDALVDVFRAARSTMDRHTPTAYQHVLADFIGEGHYARHIRHVRALCAERQGALVEAASTRLEGLLEIAPDAAGLHLAGWLAPGVDDVVAHEAAMQRGIRSWALSKFHLRGAPARGALVLGYGGFDEASIRRAVERLGRALESVRPGR